MDFLQKLGRRLLEIAPTRVVLLTAGDDTSGVFVIVLGTDSRLDLNAAGREIAEILGGRGGGTKGIFQGKASKLSARDQALEQLRQRLPAWVAPIRRAP